jgi:xylulokinase
MATLILAHDIGTSGDKATLFRADGTLVASCFAAYPTAYRRPGWAEQDPADYWSAFCRSTRELLEMAGATPSQVAVVAFSGTMMAALPVDRAGAPLRDSIIWADQRATAETARIAERVPAARVYAITGHRLSASYSAAKMMWIRQNEPDLFRRAAAFIHTKDFLVLKLTGRVCTDFSDATGMNLLDIGTQEWSAEMLEATGIPPNVLPEVLESSTVAGTITREAAAECGLAQGTPVVPGGGDGACATCGSGVVHDGEVYLSLGTSTWLGSASRKPLLDPQMRTVTYGHLRRGLYYLCGSMQAGGGSLKWFAETTGISLGSGGGSAGAADVSDPLAAEVDGVPQGCEGLLFLPYLMGERSPWWNSAARGCFVGLAMCHTRAHMLRAVLEGVAHNMGVIADAFAGQGLRFDGLRIIGGGARSATWRQILADVLERPVSTLNFMEEAASVGAAIAGGAGVGIFGSIEDASRIVRTTGTTAPRGGAAEGYRRARAVFVKAYEQLVPVFDMIAAQ